MELQFYHTRGGVGIRVELKNPHINVQKYTNDKTISKMNKSWAPIVLCNPLPFSLKKPPPGSLIFAEW